MTTVTTLASRRAASKLFQATTASHSTTATATSASPCPRAAADLVQLHAQACNGLHAALRFLTHPEIEADSAAFNQALRRAMRATTALKQMCATHEGGAA